MRLTKVFVRFYKSFNYDYERKFSRSSEPDPWEMIDDAWFPFVAVDLESSITTVVGANEAGKSHLLDAIEKVITGIPQIQHLARVRARGGVESVTRDYERRLDGCVGGSCTRARSAWAASRCRSAACPRIGAGRLEILVRRRRRSEVTHLRSRGFPSCQPSMRAVAFAVFRS